MEAAWRECSGAVWGRTVQEMLLGEAEFSWRDDLVQSTGMPTDMSDVEALTARWTEDLAS